MTVLKVLAEVVGSVELFARVALAKLVHVLKMPDAVLPVGLAHASPPMVLAARPGELFAAVAANVGFPGPGGTVVECSFVSRQGRT